MTGDDPDSRCVLRNFLGKTQDDARRMFFGKHGASFTEDLMWMTRRAFEYYLPAAIEYLTRPDCAGDWNYSSQLLLALSFRINQEKLSDEARRRIKDAAEYVRVNRTKFEFGEMDECVEKHLAEIAGA